MPGFDFPNTPSGGSTVTGPGGQQYTFDGTKWTASTGGAGPYLPLAGGTMTGPIALAADPTLSPQAANKHYVDNAINLAGNYLGTWQVAANTPNISAGGTISNANYVAVTANPATPEVAPVGIPGIAGQTIANGDRVIWAAGLGVWQILRNAGVTLSAADARYVQLAGSTMTGPLVLSADPAAAMQPVTLQYYNLHLPSGVSPGSPTASVGPGAINGTATTYMRSDAAPALANTAVTAGAYTYASMTVDAQGRLTAASSGAAPPAPSSTLPNMDGAAAVGTGTTWARADHVHPTNTASYPASNPSGFQTAAQVTSTVNASTANYLPLAGGTISGALNVNNGMQIIPNLFVKSGGSDANILILDGGGTMQGGFQWIASTSAVRVSQIAAGAVLQLQGDTNMVYNHQAYKPGGGPWADSSDARIKQVLGDYTTGLDAVMALRPVRYKFLGNDADSPDADATTSPHGQVTDRVYIGLVAQDAETVMPEMVTRAAGFIDGKAVADLRRLDTSAVTWALVNAVREMASRLAALEARLAGAA